MPLFCSQVSQSSPPDIIDFTGSLRWAEEEAGPGAPDSHSLKTLRILVGLWAVVKGRLFRTAFHDIAWSAKAWQKNVLFCIFGEKN